ncbi:acyltransferase family protein [Paraburkholderia graminis]|uniref:acyltransferase family protein n=1 Tax=Paraburkholderia graminis TaxID=60548 RepID=UPI0038B8D554
METRKAETVGVTASGRIAHVDVLACVMYFAVILYHTTIYFARYAFSTLPPQTDISVAGYIDFVMMSFGLLGVPFFFARCGYFMLSRQSANFLSRSFGKLLGLSALYIGLYTVILVIAIGDLSHMKEVLRFALMNDDAGVVGTGTISNIPLYFVWDSWFIYALIPIYLMIPVVAKAEPLRDWKAATVCMIGMYYFVFWHTIVMGILGLRDSARSNYEFYIYYVFLGYWIFASKGRLARIPATLAGTGFVLVFAANIAFGLWLYKTGSGQYLRAFRGYSAPLIPPMCVLLYTVALSAKWRVPDAVARACSSVAQVGIDIYLAHTLFLVLFLNARVFPDTHWLPLRQLAYAFLVAACSVGAAFARKRLFSVVRFRRATA